MSVLHPYTVSYCITLCFWNFVWCVGSRQSKNLFLTCFPIFSPSVFFVNSVWMVLKFFSLRNRFIIFYNVATECFWRFTVLESTVMCCEFLFVKSCLFSVDLPCIFYYMFHNLQCRERAVIVLSDLMARPHCCTIKCNKICLN